MVKFESFLGDKLDLIGIEETARRNIFSGRFQIKDRVNVFTLGERIHILNSGEPDIILLQNDDKTLKFPFEAIFKAVTRLVLDNASSEYIFNYEFFGKSNQSDMIETSTQAFHGVFEPTFKLVEV